MALVGLAVAALVAMSARPTYEASADVAIVRTPLPRDTEPAERSSLISVANNLVLQRLGTYEIAARDNALAERVVTGLNPKPDVSSLARRLSVDAPERSTALIVTARDSSPARARALANRAGTAMVSIVDSIEAEATQGRPLLQGQLSKQSLTPARTVEAPGWRNPVIIVTSFVLAGLALAATLHRLRPRLRDTVKRSGVDAAPVIVTLGATHGSRQGRGATLQRHERALHELRTAVFFMREGNASGTVIALCSASSDPSTQEIASDLAAEIAQTNARVLLVDADLGDTDRRHPDHDAAAASQVTGLSDYLSGAMGLKGLIHDDGAFHRVIAGGAVKNPAVLLHSPLVEHLLRGAADRYDYVLVVAPAASAGTGAAAVAARCDTTIVVANDRISVARFREALHTFENVDADVAGVVLTH